MGKKLKVALGSYGQSCMLWQKPPMSIATKPTEKTAKGNCPPKVLWKCLEYLQLLYQGSKSGVSFPEFSSLKLEKFFSDSVRCKSWALKRQQKKHQLCSRWQWQCYAPSVSLFMPSITACLIMIVQLQGKFAQLAIQILKSWQIF